MYSFCIETSVFFHLRKIIPRMMRNPSRMFQEGYKATKCLGLRTTKRRHSTFKREKVSDKGGQMLNFVAWLKEEPKREQCNSLTRFEILCIWLSNFQWPSFLLNESGYNNAIIPLNSNLERPKAFTCRKSFIKIFPSIANFTPV